MHHLKTSHIKKTTIPNVIIKRSERTFLEACYTPDGYTFAASDSGPTIHFFDSNTDDNTTLSSPGIDPSMISHFCFSSHSPDLLVSIINNGSIYIWKKNHSWQLIQTLQGHTGKGRFVTFSPDDTKIASTSDDHTIRVWDLKTGTCSHIFSTPSKQPHRVIFRNNTELMCAFITGQVYLWDLTKQENTPIKIFPESNGELIISHDRASFVTDTTQNTIKIVNINTQKIVKKLEGHTGLVLCLSFNSDESLLVSSSHNGTIRIWDPKAETCLRILDAHTDRITAVQFSPDGNRLISASKDGTVRLWTLFDLETQIICKELSKNMTLAQARMLWIAYNKCRRSQQSDFDQYPSLKTLFNEFESKQRDFLKKHLNIKVSDE
jgi:hypothetical protein